VAGVTAWHFAAAQPTWLRGLWALGAAIFVFATVGAIVSQVWLARLNRKSD
jgi:hypothetical protein